MKEKNVSIEHGFYQSVATLLKCDSHDHRMPDHGLVRCFGPDIHISLRNPSLHGVFHTRWDALRAIRQAIEHDFYQNVAVLLDCDDLYRKFPFRKRTRWNNRSAGNGRFGGHGLVRYFGPGHISISLHNPIVNGIFYNTTDALHAIVSKMSCR